MSSAAKDLCDLHGRLFNHRPFLQGEVRHFVREFEEAREDREVERVFQILEQVTELRDEHVDQLSAQCQEAVPGLSANLRQAQDLCRKILDHTRGQEFEQALESSQSARAQEWALFVQDIEQQRERVNEAYQKKELDLIKQYSDLENQF